MPDLAQAATTILVSVIVLVAGQLVLKSLIEPFQEHAKIRGEIAENIIFYSNQSTAINQFYFAQLQGLQDLDGSAEKLQRERLEEVIKQNWKKSDDAGSKLRQQAGQLLARTQAIPFYWFWAFIRLVPSSRNISLATGELIGMSNSMHGDRGVSERVREIAKLLRLTIVMHHLGVK